MWCDAFRTRCPNQKLIQRTLTFVLNLLSEGTLAGRISLFAKISAAVCIRHLIGKNSNFCKISCERKFQHYTIPSCFKEAWISKSMKCQQSSFVMLQTVTCKTSERMSSTEQWLLATRSTFTPNAPPHLKSPATTLSPRESLKQVQSITTSMVRHAMLSKAISNTTDKECLPAFKYIE